MTAETSSGTRPLSFTLNGSAVSLDVSPRWTLADVLRLQLEKTGTHLGCEHGVCGACTVLLDGEPVRSCLIFGIQVDGHEVRTVEGIAEGDVLHPVQSHFRAEHALQCGFCTPGFLMLGVGLLEREPDASEERIRDVLASNICRCTGGVPILKAVLAAQEEMRDADG